MVISTKELQSVIAKLAVDQAKYEYERKCIKEAMGDFYILLQDAKLVLAGGALTSLFTGKEVNDWDIYFKHEGSVGDVFATVYGHTDYDLGKYSAIVNFMTNKSVLTTVKQTKAKVQFIHNRVYPEVGDIFNSFDYTINMVAYDFESEEFIFHEDFFKDLAIRALRFNPKTLFPVTSLMRVDKYVKRGYTISKSEMLRIAFTIADGEYTTWESVKEEIGGLYGVNVDELFDTDTPFSLEAVINQLKDVRMRDKFNYSQAYSFSDVYSKIEHLTTPKFKEWYTTKKSDCSWGDSFTDNWDFEIIE